MRRIARRLSEERGIALVFAIVVLAALAAGVTTVVYVSNSSQYTATRDKSAQIAFNLAEAGIGSAMAVLHGTQSDGVTPINALDPSALPPPPPDPSAHTDTYADGTVTWGGTLNTTTQQWTIISIGHVAHGSGPTSPAVDRKLTAVSQVHPSLTQPVNNQVWNYIYAFGKTGGCDVDIGGGTAYVAAPIYAEGNLCMSNNAVVQGATNSPPTPVNVVVKGATVFGNSKSAVGTSQYPVDEAHLSGGCGASLTNLHTCDPKKDNIHAGIFDTTPPNVAVSPPDFSGYYASANPGPSHPCAAGSSNPPTFDNDTTMNDSLPTTFNVTPSTSYTCIGRDSFGNQVGELSWNASTKVLTIMGVVYVDGNITFAPAGGVASYTGEGTIYASGYMTLNGNMCGALDGSGGCNFNVGSPGGWDPNTNMMIVVAGGQDSNGNSISFLNSNGNQWQGGLYAQDHLAFANNANVEGPMIAGTISFNNNIQARPFPVITNVPVGAPGNPNVYADATAPQVTG